MSAPARNGVALCSELGHFEDPAEPCFCVYCGESVTGGTPCHDICQGYVVAAGPAQIG
ncbi:MAG: hypothetical protein ACXV5Q_12520 [Frankiaceae bacterium]